jgi:hypothetical protein
MYCVCAGVSLGIWKEISTTKQYHIHSYNNKIIMPTINRIQVKIDPKLIRESYKINIKSWCKGMKNSREKRIWSIKMNNLIRYVLDGELESGRPQNYAHIPFFGKTWRKTYFFMETDHLDVSQTSFGKKTLVLYHNKPRSWINLNTSHANAKKV